MRSLEAEVAWSRPSMLPEVDRLDVLHPMDTAGRILVLSVRIDPGEAVGFFRRRTDRADQDDEIEATAKALGFVSAEDYQRWFRGAVDHIKSQEEGDAKLWVSYTGHHASGRGWFTSLPESLVGEPELTGDTELEFDVEMGQVFPDGYLRLHLPWAGLRFEARGFLAMEVTERSVRLQGAGEFDVQPEGAPEFVLVASYGMGVDRIRVKIGNPVLHIGEALYDTQRGDPEGAMPTTELLGGSISVER